MRRFRIVHALAQCLWIIPSLGLLSGILLSLVTVAIDRRNENQLLSQSIVGNAADAQSILTTIATAVVTLTAMALTVTLVAVQLAMGQFSPRIVRPCSTTAATSSRSPFSARPSRSRSSRCARSTPARPANLCRW
jgi:uncharacterized membrane protein